jgi:tetratricopeptide (TPR) repeat protein
MPTTRIFRIALLPNLIFFAGALLAQTSNSKQTTPHPMSPQDRTQLHKALDAYDAGNAAQAEPLLRDLSKRYPANYEANEALGSLYAEGGDYAQALTFLKHAAELAPREALAQANLGAALLKLGQPNEAVVALKKATALDPKNVSALSNLGQSLMAMTPKPRPEEAATALASASKLAPQDADLKYNLAVALYQSGSAASAAKSAAVLATLPPDAMTDQVHALAADAEEHSGRFPEALAHFQKAAQMNPSDANLYALTVELLRHWTWPEAIKVANFGSERFPASSHFQVAAGIGYYANSEYKQAIRVFSHLLESDSNNASYADLLGRSCSLLAEGENAGCAEIYRFAERHPGNAVTTTYAAVAILHEPTEKHDLDKAAQLLHAATAADPTYAEAWFQMGVLDQAELHWKESVTDLKQSIALRPFSAEAHYRLSRAYAHLGQRDEAKAEIALHQTYSQQAKDSLNARMQEVMTFILKPS